MSTVYKCSLKSSTIRNILCSSGDFHSGTDLWFMVSNATFNNASVISWRSVLLVEEIGVPGENHRPVATHCQTLSHNVVSSPPHPERNSNSQH